MSLAIIKNLFEKIEKDGSGINGYEKIIQFEFTDLKESYNVKFLGERAELIDIRETPSATVQITSENFEKLTNGQLNPNTAFLFGKIKVAGDMSQLLKLSKILEYYS
ncbi:SCP2 sterol-binding domain-containing protein [Ureibacillus chungkukjangi]|uniref:SCP2 sterol-binding domain-containing protein n=1 Tax=Ureibacillus chungkukjangi TaxID=1202712 RepID=UPI00203A7906|nr:SCP2 sterol-binding domain-containing protein [Ureibacillus chungkukjangi]MCM3388447.1 SCP2 sterol-binding domain-containing protein [Ureibacillus chungkukjangi]